MMAFSLGFSALALSSLARWRSCAATAPTSGMPWGKAVSPPRPISTVAANAGSGSAKARANSGEGTAGIPAES